MSGEDLKYVFDNSKMTGSAFAGMVGIGRTKLYSLFSTPKIDDEIIDILQGKKEFEQLFINIENVKSNVKSEGKIQENNNLTLVPIKAQGGFLNGYENKAYIDSLESYPFPWVKGRCFGFEVEGFSMVGDDIRASFYPGEWVVCTELESFTWLSKGKVYVFATINGICIKQFDKLEDNKFYLKSLNKAKEYEVKPIPAKEVKRAFHIERKISAI